MPSIHRVCVVSIVFSLAACQATEECEDPEPEPADVSTSDVDTSGACTALCAAERRVAEPLGCEVPPTGVCLEACADIPDRCATAHVTLLHCSIRSVDEFACACSADDPTLVCDLTSACGGNLEAFQACLDGD